MAGEQPTPPFRQASGLDTGLAPASQLHNLKADGELQNAKTGFNCCLLVNSIRRIKRFFYAQRKTMASHWMEIGEGSAYVECKYEFDRDGDLQKLEVYIDGEGKDIKDALVDQQVADIEGACRSAAKADYEERKWDTKIDNLIELMNSETERLTR